MDSQLVVAAFELVLMETCLSVSRCCNHYRVAAILNI